MENNEENLGPQEQSTQSTETQQTAKAPNSRLIGIIAVAVVAIIAILLIFFAFFTRSPKAVVKDYIKAFNNGNAKKVMALMDYEGAAAFRAIASYSYTKGTYTYEFKDFEDEYDDIMDKVKDMDKDEKEDYKELKEKAIDTLQDTLDDFKDNKVKLSVKKVKTEKVDDCKNITKVIATLEAKIDGEKDEKDFTFYTMKKGLKNYIVYAEFN